MSELTPETVWHLMMSGSRSCNAWRRYISASGRPVSAWLAVLGEVLHLAHQRADGEPRNSPRAVACRNVIHNAGRAKDACRWQVALDQRDLAKRALRDLEEIVQEEIVQRVAQGEPVAGLLDDYVTTHRGGVPIGEKFGRDHAWEGRHG